MEPVAKWNVHSFQFIRLTQIGYIVNTDLDTTPKRSRAHVCIFKTYIATMQYCFTAYKAHIIIFQMRPNQNDSGLIQSQCSLAKYGSRYSKAIHISIRKMRFITLRRAYSYCLCLQIIQRCKKISGQCRIWVVGLPKTDWSSIVQKNARNPHHIEEE